MIVWEIIRLSSTGGKNFCHGRDHLIPGDLIFKPERGMNIEIWELIILRWHMQLISSKSIYDQSYKYEKYEYNEVCE